MHVTWLLHAGHMNVKGPYLTMEDYIHVHIIWLSHACHMHVTVTYMSHAHYMGVISQAYFKTLILNTEPVSVAVEIGLRLLSFPMFHVRLI